MERKDFTHDADANGYMIFYKGQPIGGTGCKLPRERPLHWKHARANVKDNAESAEREIASLCAGTGQARFTKAIAAIAQAEGE